MADIVDRQRRSEIMSRIGPRDTAPELAVRRMAHRMGLRFRLYSKQLPGRPDLVFARHRLAVFVHGCFWHRHDGCANATMPKTRPEFWQKKFQGNVERDRRNCEKLAQLGWRTLIVWECEAEDPIKLRSILTAAFPEERSPARKADGLTSAPASDPFKRKRDRLAAGDKPRVLDICGGAGGFSLGFLKGGFALQGAIESDPIAVATYAANLHKEASAEHRKRLAKPQNLLSVTPRRLKKALGLGPIADSVDVILAGLPCQAFARIGRSKLGSLADDPSAYRTDRRAGMYRRFLEYVRRLKPLCVVLENVPDILNHGGHNVPEEISRSLARSGYICRYTLLNAASYGVPQLRERLFLIAYHKTVGMTPKFPAATHRVVFPPGYNGVRGFALRHVDRDKSHYVRMPPQAGSLPAVSVEQAIQDLAPVFRKKWSPKDGIPDRKTTETTDYAGRATFYGKLMRKWGGFETEKHVTAHVVRHTPRDYRHFSAMMHGEQYPKMYRRALQQFEQLLARRRKLGEPLRTRAWHKAKASLVPPYDPDKFPNKWRKLEPDRPSCTLTAHLGKDSYSHIHYDSAQARTISAREAARLQSFPDGFIFHGAMNAAFRQIGNAVPPLLAFALSVEVMRALLAMTESPALLYREAAE